MNSRVSILIPCYNRAEFIIRTLRSCFNQSYSDIEVIIYDDGSTDNTADIINKYVTNIGVDKKNRIKYVKCIENKGIGYSRNVLLSLVKTEFACWLDSDDLICNERIRKCVDYMDKNPEIDIVYSNIQWFSSDDNDLKTGNVIRPNIQKYNKNNFATLAHNSTCASGFFKSNLKDFKFVDGVKLGGEDSLWLWDLIRADKKIGYIDDVLYYYRNHSNRIGIIKRKEEYQKLKDKEGLIVHNYLNNIKNPEDEHTK